MYATSHRIRLFSAAAAMLVALLLAPGAFARGNHDNWNVSVGFAGPGYSIGYTDCRNCGRGYVSGSFSSGNFYSGYGGYGSYAGYGGYGSYADYGGYGGYGGAHYSSSHYPAPYNSYYPSYGAVYYNSYPSHRRGNRHYRPVTRRVVHYENYYSEDHRDSRSYRDDRHRNADRYDNDRGYSRRAAYYDRRN